MSGTPTHEAEVSLLGSIMLSQDALGPCADLIDAASFRDTRHRLIWSAMCRLDARGGAIDAVTVGVELEAAGAGTEVSAGGFGYLLSLTTASATSVNVASHAQVVADGSKRRRLYEAAVGISQHACDTSQTVGEALSASDGLLAALLDVPGRGEVVQTQKESALALRTELLAVSQGIFPRKIPFGFNLPTLSKETNLGADPRCELVAIAARSGVGKTALGDQLADEIGRLGLGVVLYFSVEVSGEKLIARRLARRTGIDLGCIKSWKFSHAGDDDNAVHELTGMGMQREGVTTYFRAGLDVGYIARKVRQACRRGPVAAVVIDYFQVLSITDGVRYGNTTDKLDAIAAALKVIQVENGVAMYVLAQLNRGDKQRPNAPPVEKDIRGGDGLAFWASMVLLLHRPAYLDHGLIDDDGRTETATILAVKNREGKVFNLTVNHRPDCGAFWERNAGWQRRPPADLMDSLQREGVVT